MSTASFKPPVLNPACRALWVQHSAEELRAIQQKKREEADSKQEELRQLVGQKYRVLVDSADWMFAMRKLGEEISTDLESISQGVVLLENKRISALRQVSKLEEFPSSSSGPSSSASAFCLHKAISSLSQASEQVWSHIDNNLFLSACSACFSALALLKQMQSELMSQQDATELRMFVDYYGHALCELPTLIAKRSQRRLRHRGLNTQAYADALGAIWLTEQYGQYGAKHMNIDTVMSEFFNSCEQSILRSLKAASKAFSKHPRGSASSSSARLDHEAEVMAVAFSNVVQTIQNTLLQSLELFGSGGHTSHASARPAAKASVCAVLRQFRASHQDVVASMFSKEWCDAVPASMLQEKARAWLDGVQRQVLPKLQELLEHMTHGSQIGRVRDALIGSLLLFEEPLQAVDKPGSRPRSPRGNSRASMKPNADSPRIARRSSSGGLPSSLDNQGRTLDLQQRRERFEEQWKQTCLSVLGRTVRLWDELFLSAFATRFKAIISLEFSALQLGSILDRQLSRLHQRALSCAEGKPLNAFAVIPNILMQVPQAQAQSGEANQERQSKAKVSGLAGHFEEEISAVCDHFERQLATLVANLNHVLESPVLASSGSPVPPKRARSASSSAAASFGSLMKLVAEELRPYVQRMCTESISRIVNSLRKRLSRMEGEILDMGGANSFTTSHKHEQRLLVDQAVFIGAVCSRLLSSSTSLRELATFHSSAGAGASGAHTSQNAGALASGYVSQSLLQTADLGYHIWTRYLASCLGDDFLICLRKHLLRCQAEGVMGIRNVNVESTSPVPSAASPHVLSLLAELLAALYRVNGYDIVPDVLGWVLTDTSMAVLTAFEAGILDVPALQNTPDGLALQLIFDLKFLFSIIRFPPDPMKDQRKRLDALVKDLENGIDPIDYAVMLPALNERVADAVSRSTVMFGALVRLNPFPHFVVAGAASGVSEREETNPNTLALTSCARMTPFPSASLYPRKQKKLDPKWKEELKQDLDKRAEEKSAGKQLPSFIPDALKDTKGAASFLGNLWGQSYS